MPIIDTFPTRLREELEAAYEEDLDEVRWHQRQGGEVMTHIARGLLATSAHFCCCCPAAFQVFDVQAVRAALEQRLKSLESELHQVRRWQALRPGPRWPHPPPPHTHTCSSLPLVKLPSHSFAPPIGQVERLQRKFAMIHSTLAQQQSNGSRSGAEAPDTPKVGLNWLPHSGGLGAPSSCSWPAVASPLHPGVPVFMLPSVAGFGLTQAVQPSALLLPAPSRCGPARRTHSMSRAAACPAASRPRSTWASLAPSSALSTCAPVLPAAAPRSPPCGEVLNVWPLCGGDGGASRPALCGTCSMR